MDQDVDDEVVRFDGLSQPCPTKIPARLSVLRPSPFLLKFMQSRCFDLQDQLENKGSIGLGAVPRPPLEPWPPFAPFPRTSYPQPSPAPTGMPDSSTLPPVPSAPSLITLPTELLAQIVQHLRADATTTAFALTHRTLTPVAHRHMWRTCDFFLPQRHGEMGLMYTIALRPGAPTRQQYTNEMAYYGSVYSTRQKAILLRLLSLLAQMESQPGLEGLIENIVIEMGGIAAEEYAQLLRVVSPSLQQLTMAPWYRGDLGVISETHGGIGGAGQVFSTLSTDEFCAKLFAGNVYFTSLTTLVLTFGGPSHGHHLARLLWSCPALEVLSYRGGGRGSVSQAPLLDIPHLPRLRSILYDSTDCEPMALCKALVASTPNLVELTFTDSRAPCTGIHRLGDHPESEVDVSGMLDHLEKLKVVKWRYGGTSFFSTMQNEPPQSVEILAVRSSLFSHVMELPDFVRIPPMPNLRIMYAYHSIRYRDHAERRSQTRFPPIHKEHGLVIPLLGQNIYRSILAAPRLEAVYFATPWRALPVDGDPDPGLPTVPYEQWEPGKTKGMLVRTYQAEGFATFVHLRVRTRSKEVFEKPKRRKTPKKPPTSTLGKARATPLASSTPTSVHDEAEYGHGDTIAIETALPSWPISSSTTSHAPEIVTAAMIPLPPSPEFDGNGARSETASPRVLSEDTIGPALSTGARTTYESIPELSLGPAADSSGVAEALGVAHAIPVPPSSAIVPAEDDFGSLDDTFFQAEMEEFPPIEPATRLLTLASGLPLPPSPDISPAITVAAPAQAAALTNAATIATITAATAENNAGAAGPAPPPAAIGPAPGPGPGHVLVQPTTQPTPNDPPPIKPPKTYPKLPHPHVDPWVKPIWGNQARLTFTNEYGYLQERVLTYTKNHKLRWAERAYYDGMRIPHAVLQEVYECAGVDMRWTSPGRGVSLHPAAWERLDHWAKGRKEVLARRREEAGHVARQYYREQREQELKEWEGLVGITRLQQEEAEIRRRRERLSDWRPLALAPVRG